MNVDEVEVALPDGGGRSSPPDVTPEDVLAIVREVLDDDKAEEVTIIDLRGRTSLADYMVVCSGRSIRQMTTIAEHLRERLNRVGLRHLGVEGRGSTDWVLIDAGDVIVQLFRPEARAFYGLEKMWSEALLGPALPDAAAAAVEDEDEVDDDVSDLGEDEGEWDGIAETEDAGTEAEETDAGETDEGERDR